MFSFFSLAKEHSQHGAVTNFVSFVVLLTLAITMACGTVSSDNSNFLANTGVLTPAPLSIASRPLPSATVDSPYRVSLAASGGSFSYSWEISSGALPDGIGLDRDTGLLSGTTTQTGAFPFEATVTDSHLSRANASLSIVVDPPTTNGVPSKGPPDYLGSLGSDAVVQTPNTAPFTGPTGYNQIGYDTSLNPTGTDPFLRASDNTMLSGHSPSSTYSGGSNDEGWNCTGRTDTSADCSNANLYFLEVASGGCPFVEGIQLTNGVPSVVAPLPSTSTPPFSPCADLAWSNQDPSYAFMEGQNSGDPTIYKVTYAWDGTVGHSPATTGPVSIYDMGANCPLPNGTSFNQKYASPLSHDSLENQFFVALSNVTGLNLGSDTASVTNGSAIFSVAGPRSLQTDGSLVNAVIRLNGVNYTIATIPNSTLGTLTIAYAGTTTATATVSIPRGQGTGLYNVWVQLTPAGCAVYNTYTGTLAGSGAYSGIGATISTGCHNDYIHDGFMLRDGLYAWWSNSGGASVSCGNSANAWQGGTATGISCTGAGAGGAPGALCLGHEAVGWDNFFTISNPTFYNFPPTSMTGSSAPSFGAVPPAGFSALNCEDHFSWRNATSTNTQPIIGTTANNNFSTSSTSSTWTAPGANEIYGLTSTGTLIRFGHTFALGPGSGCNGTAGPFDYYFTAQNAIGVVSQDGRMFSFSSSMLGTLGTDVDGHPRADIFVVLLQ
jgi:hypothetical protein